MAHPATRHYGNRVLTPRHYSSTGFEPAAFKESIHHPGSYETGYLTGWEADHLLGEALRRNRPIRPLAHAAFSISRRRGQEGAGHPFVVLDMVAHPQRLTDRQYEDLLLIEHSEHRAHIVRDEDGCPPPSPPASSASPAPRPPSCWNAAGSRGPRTSNEVWISAAGRMAMASRWHADHALNWRLLPGLYLDAALTAAATARARTESAQRA